MSCRLLSEVFLRILSTGASCGVRLIRAEQSAHDFRDLPVPELVITLPLKANMSFRWNIGDGWTPVETVHPGAMNVAPPNTEIEFEIGGDHTILNVCIPVSEITTVLEEYGNHTIGMPATRFARTFKATTEQTPHQYVLSRRIARAQDLLAAGDMPLAQIAYACGFASQSHMTDVFRQKLGVTPGRYRKEVRG